MIYFFLPPQEYERLAGGVENVTADASQGAGSTAYCWVIQTLAALRSQNFTVNLTDRVPTEGLMVFCAHHRQEPLSARREGLVLVSIRADGAPTASADYEIVLNGCFADEQTRFFVPHWPQPGLIARRAERGNTIRTIGFKGQAPCLAPGFYSDQWKHFLADRGIEWKPDSPEWGKGGVVKEANYHDFSELDLIVAIRPDVDNPYRHKPALKLTNAWHAGVPALLGPEAASLELWESELDFIQIGSVEDAMAAVDRLVKEPELYHRMRERAAVRAREFTVEAITRRWIEVLERIAKESSQKPKARLRFPRKLEMAMKLAKRREYGGFGVMQFMRDLRRGHVS